MRGRGPLILVVSALLGGGCGSSGSPEAPRPSGASSSGQAGSGGAGGEAPAHPATLRIGQFNLREMSTDKLVDPNDGQATAAATILGRFGPDIACINEMQYDIADVPSKGLPGAPASSKPGSFDGGAENAQRLADRIAGIAPDVVYVDTVTTVGNSGFPFAGGTGSFALRGWGEFEGRYNTAVLSRFPILKEQIRVIHDFPWEALPDNELAALKGMGLEPPPGFPLFEKALLVIPVQVGDLVVHLVLLHPVPPAFEALNPYRNHDELHGLRLFLEGKLPGVDPLPDGARFVVVGDLNADPDGDGDGSLSGSIGPVVDSDLLNKFFPSGAGTKGKHAEHNTYLSGCGFDDGTTVSNPTTKYQLQIDYILPSKTFGMPTGGEVFFPDYLTKKDDFDLACHASDHRFVYEDIGLD